MGHPTGCCPGHRQKKSVWAAVMCAALCIRLHCLLAVALAAQLIDQLHCPQQSHTPQPPSQPFPVHLTGATHQAVAVSCNTDRLFQRLMSPEGPNLRRYYLPGLEHLKVELSCFELLLSSHQPLLHQHLLDVGLPALLYAAQWLMTTYACPFPVHVRLQGQGF